MYRFKISEKGKHSGIIFFGERRSASPAFRRAFARAIRDATISRGEVSEGREARSDSSHEHDGTACEGTECDWLRLAWIGGFLFFIFTIGI